MAQSRELRLSFRVDSTGADGHYRRSFDDSDGSAGRPVPGAGLNKVTRLILVGDPNQLPPIGPGRPFVDIIAWLEATTTVRSAWRG